MSELGSKPQGKIEVATWASIIGAIVMVAGLVWGASQIAAAASALAHSFDEFKSSVNTQFEDVRTRIAAIPTQDVRISAMERQMAESSTRNTLQDQRLGALEQGQAVAVATFAAVQHTLQSLEDMMNGRSPNGARK